METVETASVSSGPVYAGFWRRFVGWLLDLLILIVITHWSLVLVSSFLTTPIPDTLSFSVFFSALWPTALALIVIDFIIIALYYCLFEASQMQATIGKYIAGIKVTDMGGSRISYGKAFLRRVYSLLSIIPIFIGYIVAGFTSRKQTFHDMLAKTVVIVSKPRKTIALVGIVILTIIAGILSDMFLGAGFHVSFNSPSVHYDTQSGLQNFTVQKGDEVDPQLKENIIRAYGERTTLFASNDLPKIRDYFSSANANDEALLKQVSEMSDSDFQNMVKLLNQIQTIATEDILRSADTLWTFNEAMNKVKIKARVTPTSETPFNNVTIDMLYTNGKWY